MAPRPKPKPTQAKRVRLYGLTRIDSPRLHTHAWRVTLTRKGRTFNRHFSDGVYGGAHAALKAAKRYRERVIREHPPLTRIEYAQIKRKNNRSGVPGVCRVGKPRMRGGKRYLEWFWVATWTPVLRGPHKRKSYSVKRYGEQGAYRRALRVRRAGLAQMEDGPHLAYHVPARGGR